MITKELLQEIKDAAYAVRTALLPGYLECVYRNALVYELQSRGLDAKAEVPIKAYYKGVVVGDYRVDILVENEVILELKACSELNAEHEKQLVNYLKVTGLECGFLINYGDQKYRIIFKTKNFDKPHKEYFE